jgi:hypothetical protein
MRDSATAHHTGHRVPRNPVRYRAGWMMVKIGPRPAGPVAADWRRPGASCATSLQAIRAAQITRM